MTPEQHRGSAGELDGGAPDRSDAPADDRSAVREPVGSGNVGDAPSVSRDVSSTATRDGDDGDGPPTADAADGDEPAPAGKRRHGRSFLGELPFLVVVALGMTLLLKAFVVQAFYIPSGSMENTLQVGDRVLVNKFLYDIRDIRRGEVVVFNGLDSFTPEFQVAEPTNAVTKALRAVGSAFGFAPPGERDFIKRVIGVPGDKVRCCDDEGRLLVNGQPLDEPYLFPGDAPSDTAFDIEVPQGRLWVMGDHRARSADSRAHLGDPGGGTVPADKVIGRAFVIVWPAGRWDGLGAPDAFDDVPDAASSGAPEPLKSGVPAVAGFAVAVPVTLVRRWMRQRRNSPANAA